MQAGGVKNALCNKVAGWVGIWVALVAFYCATAILTGEVWDYVSSHPLHPQPHLFQCTLLSSSLLTPGLTVDWTHTCHL